MPHARMHAQIETVDSRNYVHFDNLSAHTHTHYSVCVCVCVFIIIIFFVGSRTRTINQFQSILTEFFFCCVFIPHESLECLLLIHKQLKKRKEKDHKSIGIWLQHICLCFKSNHLILINSKGNWLTYSEKPVQTKLKTIGRNQKAATFLCSQVCELEQKKKTITTLRALRRC